MSSKWYYTILLLCNVIDHHHNNKYKYMYIVKLWTICLVIDEIYLIEKQGNNNDNKYTTVLWL